MAAVGRARREHVIRACYAKQSRSEETFCAIARRSKEDFLLRPVVSDTPPPEREIVMVLSLIDHEQIHATALDSVFGFIFERDVFLQNMNVRAKFHLSLDGLIGRLVRDNPIIRFYGIYLALYVGELPMSVSVPLFSFFDNWRKQVAAQYNVEATFDIIQDPVELDFVLRNALRNIVHGDIKAQFAAAAR